MSKERYLISSESVTEGHPDKLADQISDAVLDAILTDDPMGRVACETLVSTGFVQVAGEITTKCYVDIPAIARKTIREIGYTRAKYGFDAETCAILTAIDEQSPDIAQGVNNAQEFAGDEFDRVGAGDQGFMVGYACDETEELMPLPISLAHRLARRLALVRKNKTLNYLRPDGKSQVTIEYEGFVPKCIDTVVVSHQHDDNISYDEIKNTIISQIINPVLAEENFGLDCIKYFINPTGRFVIGGPHGDTGLTGRKIIVDTYGGMGRHGGGAFSGKDPSKVDRSAAYMARYIAKNIVASGACTRCEVQLAYAIGVPFPVSVMVNTFGTAQVEESRLAEAVKKLFDLSPAGIVKTLDLKKPIYQATASYGHFGRDIFAWEKTDMADAIRRAL